MNVSIVIPTYNRLPILEKCLFALENQKLNTNISNYEVIVVDDGSTDGTTSWINNCLLYTSPSPRDRQKSRMPSSA